MVKPRLYGEDDEAKNAALYTLTYVLEKILKLLHPFMPFITEEIYSYLGKEEKIIVAQWPHYDENENFEKEEQQMEIVMEAVRSIRNSRAEMNVPPSKKATVMVVADGKVREAIDAAKIYIKTLASASEVEFIDESAIPQDAVSMVIEGAKIFLPLAELIDFEKEIERLEKEKAKLEGEIKRAAGKLTNQGFLAKAPQSLVDEETAKKEKYEEMLSSINERILQLRKK